MEKFNWKMSLFGTWYTWLIGIFILPKFSFIDYVIICIILSIVVVLVANIRWIKEKLNQK